MNTIYKWVSTHICPPRWMFDCRYSAPDEVTDEVTDEELLAAVIPTDPFAVLPLEFRLHYQVYATTEGQVVRDHVTALKHAAKERGLSCCEYRDEGAREYVWKFDIMEP